MEKIVGVDTSKAFLDVFISESATGQFENSDEGIAKLADFIKENDGTMAVMEASGGVERQAFYSLWKLGVPCAIVNPRNVRDFAKAMGHLEKTDAIDAKVIAYFAKVKGIIPMPPPSEKQQRLSALSVRVRQVISDKSIQKQRLSSTHEDFAREGLLEMITVLKRQEKSLSKQIAELIDEDPIWAELNHTLRTIKGVADRTVATIMADLPEIGTLKDKAISKLVGLAPLADDSGKRQGKRHTRGGRSSVRCVLFLVADIARKYDQSLTNFRNRLIEAGKPKMVIRIALAHKLLIRLNAKARDTRKILTHST